MLEHLPAMIWCVDVAGENAWFNRAFRRFAGWDDQQGRERSEVVHADDREAFVTDLCGAIAGRDPVRLEARNIRGDGECRLLLDTAVPWYNADGSMGGYVGCCQDITDCRQTTEELKSLADTVSRDFRGPVASIRGYLRETERCLHRLTRLLDENGGESATGAADGRSLLQEEIPVYQGKIAIALERLDTLLGGLAHLASLGRRIPYAEPVATRELVESIIASHSAAISERGITVSCSELPLMVVDQLALEQILGNLIDNAIKYLEPSRPGDIRISSEMCDLEVLFHVKDNGRGIRQEDMATMFQLFRRGASLDVPGDGMGLPLVKTMVRELGGRIWCVSTPGEGSTFSVALPFVPLHRSEDATIYDVCEFADSCPFFNDSLGGMPTTATKVKERYCYGSKHDCARYMVFSALGGGKVPRNLAPSDVEEARHILAGDS